MTTSKRPSKYSKVSKALEYAAARGHTAAAAISAIGYSKSSWYRQARNESRARRDIALNPMVEHLTHFARTLPENDTVRKYILYTLGETE